MTTRHRYNRRPDSRIVAREVSWFRERIVGGTGRAQIGNWNHRRERLVSQSPVRRRRVKRAESVIAKAFLDYLAPLSSFRFAAQYFFILTLTAFFCAADIFERLCRRRSGGSSTASGIAGLTAEPYRK